MQYRPLGSSGLNISAIGLGTMTWGEQNSQVEAFQQMDYALDQGINFFDTAEMYPIPPKNATYGQTESIIGNWLQSSGQRQKIVLATKILGPATRFPDVRGGELRLDRANITQAVDDSLKRLKTDYIDLYQLHWPERNMNMFGKLGYRHNGEEETTSLEETLGALDEVVKSGKVRHVGVSNESAWGLMRYLHAAEVGGGPRMVSIQNPYSLLNRSFEVGLSEVAIRESCGLLAYAPIAAGALSGKYLDGKRPAGARMTLFPQNTRYFTENGIAATREYVMLAEEAGLRPEVMAGAFVHSRDFVTTSIIGATSLEQLKIQLSVTDIRLDDSILDAIDLIHAKYTYPCP